MFPYLLVSLSPYLTLATLLLATLLRFYYLDRTSLWSDEGNTWAMLGRSWGEIAQAAARDIHPPGYYWLLKGWSLLFGDSALAMRSFSAAAGVLLVGVVARLGWLAAPSTTAQRWMPHLAALLAVINAFQVYYSQEARMYMLLALESALLFWALFVLVGAGDQGAGWQDWNKSRKVAAIGFALAGAAGMWTHYSFAIVLVAADLAFLARWLAVRRAQGGQGRSLLVFVGMNLLIGLAFLPWLPVAVTSVRTWPKGGTDIGLVAGLELTLRTLLFGPLGAQVQPSWPWLVAAGVLPLAGLWALRRQWAAVALGLWLLLPVSLMAVLGLFTPAFLKFLLVASPAWCLLAAAAPFQASRLAPRDAQAGTPTLGWPGAVALLATAGFGIAAAAMALPPYYTNATARDNYKGIAAYLAAVGAPAHDLVVLDAPGQQEVWRYYDPGLPVLALPASRPPDAAATEAALAEAAAGRRRIYALFWATDEADPARLVESWLDRNTFKALDLWQGNLRFAAYAQAGDLVEQPVAPLPFGDAFALVAQAQPAFPQTVAAGDAALVQLRWEALQDVMQRYKVSLQLLDARSQVVAQRDSEPAGGSSPTDTWRAGQAIEDNYALPIPFGTPPGAYRLILAVYAAEGGERLLREGEAQLDLGQVIVARPAGALPPALVPMQQRVGRSLGPVQLVGYDAYRKDAAHAPSTPVKPGDTVHFTLYWQAPDPLPAGWPEDGQLTLRLGDQVLAAPLAGGAYPTGRWQAGELVRGEFDLVYAGGDRRAELEIDGQSLTLAPLP